MKFLYILRHGQTDYNKQGVLQGRTIDAPLNELGNLQSKAFYNSYASEGFELIITSELQRSVESVQPFVNEGIKHIVDERITEFSWGINEGMPIDELVISNYKSMLKSWASGELDARIQGGESGAELLNRVSAFSDEIREREEEKILICTHGRTLKMLIVTLMGWQIGDMERVKHSNAALFLLEHAGDGFIMKLDNDLSHLPAHLHQNSYWDK
jgi:probable phosphoglycerate mutase